jgi:hypothetical protein
MAEFKPISFEEFESASEMPVMPQAPSQPIVSGVIPGTEKSKSPFTEGQRKDAMFALRMKNSIEEMERLEDAGFDPRNFTESVVVERGPFIPDIAENFLLSPQYQLYKRAMNDFAMAQLRKDTGAVINDSEMDWMRTSIQPLPGDSDEVIAAKRRARREYLASMKASAGKAYDSAVVDFEKESDYRVTEDSALRELVRRAKSNPELAAKLRERGLIP